MTGTRSFVLPSSFSFRLFIMAPRGSLPFDSHLFCDHSNASESEDVAIKDFFHRRRLSLRNT